MFHMSMNLPFSSCVGGKICRCRERHGRGIGGIVQNSGKIGLGVHSIYLVQERKRWAICEL